MLAVGNTREIQNTMPKKKKNGYSYELHSNKL